MTRRLLDDWLIFCADPVASSRRQPGSLPAHVARALVDEAEGHGILAAASGPIATASPSLSPPQSMAVALRFRIKDSTIFARILMVIQWVAMGYSMGNQSLRWRECFAKMT